MKQFNSSISEMDNWNVARGYSESLILMPLIKCQEYEMVATFGTTDINMEFQLSPEMKILGRIRGLIYLNKELENLLNQTTFAVYGKFTKTMYEFLEAVKNMRKDIPKAYMIVKNHIRKTESWQINEEQFFILLNHMTDIRREIMIPLHKSRLIFPYEDSLTPDEIKDQIKKEYINAG